MCATIVGSSLHADYSKYNSGLLNNDDLVTKATKTSAVNNRTFISGILKQYLTNSEHVFEVGTGTGDQTIYFCEQLPNITWQTSDRECYHKQIIEILNGSGLSKDRLKEPVRFDIEKDTIEGTYDVIYASNVVHCIPWETTEILFSKASTALKVSGLIILYGPYNISDPNNIEGFTSQGNRNFNGRLKGQDPSLGLRDIADMKKLAKRNGLELTAEHPHKEVNNYILIFKKTAPK